MKLAFFGSSRFACPALRALHDRWGVDLVITQPDRPVGRHAEVAPTAIKQVAEQLGIPLAQPEDINAPDAVERLESLSPDAIVVASYGQLLRPSVFRIPPMGTINIHASLLPAYRGAAPVNWAILNGESVTGITTFFIERGLDTGEILMKQELQIGPDETAGELEERLAVLGADVVVRTMDGLQQGTLSATPQPAEGVSVAPCLTREHGRIDWATPSDTIHNLVRGTSPWPGAWTVLHGRRIKVHRTRRTDIDATSLSPGQIGPLESRRLLVATSDRFLEIVELQCEGKCCASGWDFLQGVRQALSFRCRPDTAP